jgi:hypothetical protein
VGDLPGKGVPPLCKAAETGDVDSIRAICRAFATLTAETSESSDASTSAGGGERRQWIHALRTLNRADVLNGVYSVEELVDTPEQFCGFTPLMLAAREGHLQAVRVLVEEMGADLEHVSDDGKVYLDSLSSLSMTPPRTALMLASMCVAVDRAVDRSVEGAQ